MGALSIPKLQLCNRWSLRMEYDISPTLYWTPDYLSRLELKLIRVSKRGHMGYWNIHCKVSFGNFRKRKPGEIWFAHSVDRLSWNSAQSKTMSLTLLCYLTEPSVLRKHINIYSVCMARSILGKPQSITVTSKWAQIKVNIKAPRHWPLCGEFTGDRWIPRTNGR